MPGGDRTGPMGQGAMTGRGMGVCSGNTAYAHNFGRGIGCGRGMGKGFRNRAFVQPTKEMLVAEKEWLQQRIQALDSEMNQESEK